jgi:hypothetical protein
MQMLRMTIQIKLLEYYLSALTPNFKPTYAQNP